MPLNWHKTVFSDGDTQIRGVAQSVRVRHDGREHTEASVT